MNTLLVFALGLLTMFVICCSIAAWYYAHAKRRVKQIEAAIANYQKATTTVNEALNHCDNTKGILSSKRPVSRF